MKRISKEEIHQKKKRGTNFGKNSPDANINNHKFFVANLALIEHESTNLRKDPINDMNHFVDGEHKS